MRVWTVVGVPGDAAGACVEQEARREIGDRMRERRISARPRRERYVNGSADLSLAVCQRRDRRHEIGDHRKVLGIAVGVADVPSAAFAPVPVAVTTHRTRTFVSLATSAGV